MDKKKIMIIDDEKDVAFSVEYNLNQDKSYEIRCVNSGEKCLEILKNNEFSPDLIILDIMMPKMNGWEVFKLLKENPSWEKIPVVFLTARANRTAENAGKFLGDDYIEKPYDPKDLKKRIKKILSKN